LAKTKEAKNIKEPVIVDGVRTAIGRMGGNLAGSRAEDLAAITIEGLVQKTKINPQEIDDVIIRIAAVLEKYKGLDSRGLRFKLKKC